MPAGSVWTMEETKMAFALYFLIGPSKADSRNPDVRALAAAIDRTPGAVALKLANIAAFDQNRVAEGRVGMKHGNKLDRGIWIEYDGGGDEFLGEATDLLRRRLGESSLSARSLDEVEDGLGELPEGKERAAMVSQRVNQRYFREILLSLYGGRCCLTHLAVPELLVASHIKPWAAADPRTERLAASNGLLLNALHDRAFDRGLMTIDGHYRVRISGKVRHDAETERCLWRFDSVEIELPKSHPPAREFIEYHNDVVFQG